MIHPAEENWLEVWRQRHTMERVAASDLLDDARCELRQMVDAGAFEADFFAEEEIEHLSLDEIQSISGGLVRTFEDEFEPRRGLRRLHALIDVGKKLEKALVARSKPRRSSGGIEDSQPLIFALPSLDEPEAGPGGPTSDGRMIYVGASFTWELLSEDPVLRFSSPQLSDWLHGKVVGLIEDAIEAFQGFLRTLRSEDRRRTLLAILASVRATAILGALAPSRSAPLVDVGWATPQVESAGGWSGLHAPVL